jgi:hypothetical protein
MLRAVGALLPGPEPGGDEHRPRAAFGTRLKRLKAEARMDAVGEFCDFSFLFFLVGTPHPHSPHNLG